jgi:hypothetical protein
LCLSDHAEIGYGVLSGLPQRVENQEDILPGKLSRQGDLGSDADRGPAWPWPVEPAETRFIGEQDPQATASPGGRPLGFPHSMWKAIFLKAS